MRERNCQFPIGTLTTANHESGNCPITDKFDAQRQTRDNYTECAPLAFPDTTIKETEIVTQVKVEFQVEIKAVWTPELTDTQSEEFRKLAQMYEFAFFENLRSINEVEGATKIKFTEVRVKRFIQIETISRKRRSSNELADIKAEMETAFDMIGEKDDNNENQIAPESQGLINADIAEQITDRVEDTVEEAMENDSAGELNFLRVPNQIVTKTVVETLPSLSDHFIMDCNCNTGKTMDYHECYENCEKRNLKEI